MIRSSRLFPVRPFPAATVAALDSTFTLYTLILPCQHQLRGFSKVRKHLYTTSRAQPAGALTPRVVLRIGEIVIRMHAFAYVTYLHMLACTSLNHPFSYSHYP